MKEVTDLGCTATPMLPEYQSHKKVWALKIKAIKRDGEGENRDSDGSAIITPEEHGYDPFEVDAEYIHKHKPQVGGYFVVYKDGYKSFSPAKAFEEGNYLIEEGEINETRELLSDLAWAAYMTHQQLECRLEFDEKETTTLITRAKNIEVRAVQLIKNGFIGDKPAIVAGHMKSFQNTDSDGAKKNVSDLVIWGDGDLFKLISKAHSKKEQWMKSTKAMEISGVGCVVQVTTQQYGNVAEALVFVPGVKIDTLFKCSDGEKVWKSDALGGIINSHVVIARRLIVGVR